MAVMHPTAGGPPITYKPGGYPPKGTSRFTVLYHKTSGTKKEKQWREGTLAVSFVAAVLSCTETNTCVTVVKGPGLVPNRVYQAMERARRGAAWVTGTQLTVGAYTAVVEEVRALHLIAYDEEVVWGDGKNEAKTAVAGPRQPQAQQDTAAAARPRRQLLHTAALPQPVALHCPPAAALPSPSVSEERGGQAAVAAAHERSYNVWPAATCVAPQPMTRQRQQQQQQQLTPPQVEPKRKRSRREVMAELQECFPWL